MNGLIHHLVMVPVLLPLFCGALMILVAESRHELKLYINMASVIGLLLTAFGLLWLTDGGHWPDGIGVYLAANWAAPFGIALLADRLSSLMLLLAAVLGGATLLYSVQRWSRIGVHFHSLFQFLLMGINGAFLTHDLFNLFVFFEVMLAASYGLLLHGYNVTRIRAGLQYIAVNLVASLVFLIGLALVYGTSGTLNMADLAMRIPGIGGGDLALLKVGVVFLAIAFLVKCAMWPLCFWLPTTYAAASPPVAAMMVLTTKIGAYVILRVWTLVLGGDAAAAAGFALDLLLFGGMATIIFGSAGLLASESPARIGGYAAIVSSGTLLAAIGYGHEALVAAALYYLVGSTLAIAAFMLLIELVERIRSRGAALLALTMEAFAIEETPEEPVGVGIPAALAFLGLAFATCAVVISGLPPLSGFVAKFGLIHALLQPDGGAEVTGITWALMALFVLSGFAAIVSLMRFGVRTFWASGVVSPPRLQVSEVVPIGLLLLLGVALTVHAGAALDFLGRTAADLQRPTQYVERVLSAPVIPGPLHEEPGR